MEAGSAAILDPRTDPNWEQVGGSSSSPDPRNNPDWEPVPVGPQTVLTVSTKKPEENKTTAAEVKGGVSSPPSSRSSVEILDMTPAERARYEAEAVKPYTGKGKGTEEGEAAKEYVKRIKQIPGLENIDDETALAIATKSTGLLRKNDVVEMTGAQLIAGNYLKDTTAAAADIDPNGVYHVTKNPLHQVVDILPKAVKYAGEGTLMRDADSPTGWSRVTFDPYAPDKPVAIKRGASGPPLTRTTTTYRFQTFPDGHIEMFEVPTTRAITEPGKAGSISQNNPDAGVFGAGQGGVNLGSTKAPSTSTNTQTGGGAEGTGVGAGTAGTGGPKRVGQVSPPAGEYKAAQAALTQTEKTLANITSYERTARGNLNRAIQQAKRVVDTGSPWVNKPLRQVSRGLLGSGDQAAYDTAMQVAQNEIARVLTGSPTGGGGILSDKAREEVQRIIGSDYSLAMILRAATIIKQDMDTRLESLGQTRNELAGRVRQGVNIPPPPGVSTKIRVKIKASGQTGKIDPKDFDPNTMEKL